MLFWYYLLLKTGVSLYVSKAELSSNRDVLANFGLNLTGIVREYYENMKSLQ